MGRVQKGAEGLAACPLKGKARGFLLPRDPCEFERHPGLTAEKYQGLRGTCTESGYLVIGGKGVCPRGKESSSI